LLFLLGKLDFYFVKKKHIKGWDWTWQVPKNKFDNALANKYKKQ